MFKTVARAAAPMAIYATKIMFTRYKDTMMKPVRLVRSLLVIALFCVLSTYLEAQASGKHSIRLKTGTIAAPGNAEMWLDSMAGIPVPVEPVEALIHFNALPTLAQRNLLEQNGIKLVAYIPENTFTAIIHFPVDKALLKSVPLHSIINVEPEMKADAYIWKKATRQRTGMELLVSFHPGIDGNTVKAFISSRGGRIEKGAWERYGAYKVMIAPGNIRKLAQWYGVSYISPVPDKVVSLDNQSMPPVKSNIAVGAAMYGGYGLNGDSVTVGVGDDASGVYHIDTRERITNFNPAAASLHGQLVNGMIGSAAIVDPFAATMTPHVSLVDHYFDNILGETGAMYNDYNMTVCNNSYALIVDDCDYSGTYDVYSRFIDTLALEYPNVQNVFAAGNDGLLLCAPFPVGFTTVAGGYQPAKNTIVVGSMTDALIKAIDESRGPTKDGRLKPEIISIGLGSYSCAPDNSYSWTAGTSMASPQVAGGLAALIQEYKRLNGGVQPRADLMKAVLLNGAMDLGNPGPDFSYGYGSMDMNRSLQILNNHDYSVNSISNGDSQTLSITVPAGTGQVKVMLYWNDVPANPASAIALVNDLDLTVTDASGATHLPLVLDPTAANVNNNATEGADHLNNSEQVTITKPTAGTMTVHIKGYSVPFGPQPFVLVYDLIPDTLQMTSPKGGEQFPNMTGDSVRIYWDAVSDGNTFTGQFSQDNGATWTTISDSIPPDWRYCGYLPFGVNSGNCLMRIINNGTSQVETSQRFVVNTEPTVILDTAQCPGYINIHWSPVPNATGYYIWRKTGLYIQVVDSVTGINDTTYSFSGMPLNSMSYVAVQPIMNGLHGYRSFALFTQANAGNCTNPVSKGDLMVEKLVAPGDGRLYTTSQLSVTTPFQVSVRNLYQLDCNHFIFSYQVNGGSWQSVANPVVIPANSSATVSISGIPFANPGTYTITTAVTNTDFTDPQFSNDTMVFTLLNLPNDTMSLDTPFFDGFEALSAFAVNHDSMGVSPNSHWDFFESNDSGRLRSFVSDDITITGSRSISLDEVQCTANGSKNTFVGTFNLVKYDTAINEVRVDFDYILHGNPKTDSGNVVTARGNDTTAWTPLFTYDLTAYPGYVTHVASLSLTDALRKEKVNFSSSSQVSFGQNDTSLIALVNYGNGITLDNFKMYTVSNDAELLSVVSPLPTNCGLAASAPLVVQVRNGVQNTLHNVQLFYNVNGGTTFTGTIDSIPAKTVINYTFSQAMNLPAGTTYNLNVWLVESGDSYSANDSILDYNIRNSITYNTFPYLENFEASDGGYFSGGFLDSWQYGTPAAPIIHNAASGTKAWKTNLTGNYSNLEKSYLYSPCFDISRLIHPRLSFSAAMAIENCGSTLCDAGYIEYSFDGTTWTKLGASGQGTNWYDPTFDVWNTENFTRWHVATIPLPELGGGQQTRFRFVLSADPGVNFEGIAVDDIHIYDLYDPIYPTTGPVSVEDSLSGNAWTDDTLNKAVLASLQAGNQSIGNVTAALFTHDTLSNPDGTQYTFPRNYAITTPTVPADSIGVRLYLTDSDFVSVLSDTACPGCAPVSDAYRLGITQYYNGHNPGQHNGTLTDDTGGVFTYYPYQSVTWVPYDRGYYAQINAKPLSEFWFNNGGPTGMFPAATDYLSFAAWKNGTNATTYWYSLIDTAVNTYSLQRSFDDSSFTDVLDTAANHNNPGIYSYTDPVNVTTPLTIYYRLRWTMTGKDSAWYSPVRAVNFSDTASGMISFTARMISSRDVQVSWASAIDPITSRYVLERAVGNQPYTFIAGMPSLHQAGQTYSFTDAPPQPIGPGTPIHYRLTAKQVDSSTVEPPIQTVNWVNANSIVTIYPNPTYNGAFTIVWNAPPGTVMNVNITDIVGRSMYKTTATATQWTNSTQLETFSRPQGVYSVIVDIGGTRSQVDVVYQ